MLDVPIYGRIATLELFRPNGDTQDLLFITTERHGYCVLQWDAKAHEVITRTKGDVSDQTGYPTDNGQIGLIDPDCRLIGLHLYDGLFKVIPFGEEGKLKEAFSIWFKPQALDLKFLYGCQNPTIVVLYQDNNDARHVKTYEVPLEDDRLTERRKYLWALNNLDNGASLLIPVPQPVFGVLIIGEKAIVYCDASAVNDTYPIGRGLHSIRAYAQVDAYRYLLGDRIGGLHLLVITHEKKKVAGVTINHLQETSIASTISYLGGHFVYIGSSYGDSQLVKLNLQHDVGGSPMEVVKSFVNLGPIGDFCVVDLEKQGQSQVVACSGAYKDGSLRIVRSAIGLHEQVLSSKLFSANVLLFIRSATIAQSICQCSIYSKCYGMWSLRSATDHSFLVVSFIRATRFFEMDREYVLKETPIEGFNSEDQTLFCHDAVWNQLVQVTPNSVRLVNSTSRDLKDEWFAPDSCSLTIATANATQVYSCIYPWLKVTACMRD
ncbi:dna damage-binding protein 1 [Nicotiana attenuata]|uniref:Dna damage-binding protein 1 n=1 Tax=Nicotiana attenuata TaxID=49451 RepID=A0A1J6IHB3_NICAT|nr:dna damage-binding protein 1 [Nicotiana attenuata]